MVRTGGYKQVVLVPELHAELVTATEERGETLREFVERACRRELDDPTCRECGRPALPETGLCPSHRFLADRPRSEQRRGGRAAQPPRKCSVLRCDRKHLARGWCSVHYKRALEHGDAFPDVPIGAIGGRGQTLAGYRERQHEQTSENPPERGQAQKVEEPEGDAAEGGDGADSQDVGRSRPEPAPAVEEEARSVTDSVTPERSGTPAPSRAGRKTQRRPSRPPSPSPSPLLPDVRRKKKEPVNPKPLRPGKVVGVVDQIDAPLTPRAGRPLAMTAECSACGHTTTEQLVHPVAELVDAWTEAAAALEQALHTNRDGCPGPMTATAETVDRPEPRRRVEPQRHVRVGGVL